MSVDSQSSQPPAEVMLDSYNVFGPCISLSLSNQAKHNHVHCGKQNWLLVTWLKQIAAVTQDYRLDHKTVG